MACGEVGMMARSLAGHDKDCLYLIIRCDDQYAYLVDGTYRTVDRPKKKKWKHIQIVHRIAPWIAARLESGELIQNADVIRARREYGKIKEER